ncbi:MAG TPA: FkbM family methyltransferase [Verrucomicrobiae bacterium]|nr:FkbM family methyltransferase [Verrucomicrobiae bacterium]
MVSDLLVGLYRVVHGRLHLPGAGWLLRRLAVFLPRLQAYPWPVREVGVALLDFREVEAFGMVNISLGEAHDRNLLRCLEKALRPGDVFWDVGANIGIVSGHFAHPRFQLSSLHAFEPNPGPLKTLQSLFSGNARCIVHPFGLGDKDQTITLNLSAAGSSVGSMSRDLHEGKQIQVQVRCGDGVRREQGLPAPQVMKIDVEGFEPSVFAGLAETVAAHRPILVFEHIFLSDEQIRKLIPKNYALYFIQDDASIITDFANRRQGHDAILVPAEKATRLGLQPTGPGRNLAADVVGPEARKI